MKTVDFSKYQGLGNDFILIDERTQSSCEHLVNKSSKFISNLCDRNFGIGADGVVFVLPSSQDSYARMRIINADSSEPEMCGNGIRCLIKYLIDSDNLNKPSEQIIDIATLSGLISASYYSTGLIEINMGKPFLNPIDIPTTLVKSSIGIPEGKIHIDNKKYQIYSVGMGNPHLITYCNNLENIEFEKIGEQLETCKYFPNKTNVHFVQVIDSTNLKMVVWERGCGLTLACGTGACASVVASNLLGYTHSRVKVNLPGGFLDINWPSITAPVYMKGPADLAFKGYFNLADFL